MVTTSVHVREVPCLTGAHFGVREWTTAEQLWIEEHCDELTLPHQIKLYYEDFYL